MLKAPKIDISQTNLANFGTELERNVKRAAAEGEAAWSAAGVGTAAGVHVWRIEKFKVVPQDKSEFGSFRLGDSYIVLESAKKTPSSDALAHHIYFWLGEHTTQDEAGTAAYKTVELDDKLGGAAVQHREVSGCESPAFVALFAGGIKYLEGGVESGFKHVEKDVHRARLLHCKGVAGRVVVADVPLKAASLNHGDVFIADSGLKIFLWAGQSSSQPERQAAAALARAIKDERGGKAELINLDAHNGGSSDEDAFFALLGGNVDQVAPAAGDDATVPTRKILLRLNDGTDAPKPAASAGAATETVAAPKDDAPAPLVLGPFNVDVDADALREALDNLIGYDKAYIVALFSQRDRAQLQQIAKAYDTKHGRSLKKDLHSKIGSLSGDTRSLVELLLAPSRAVVDAIALNEAIGVVSQVTMDDISTGTFAKVKKSVLVDIIVQASLDPKVLTELAAEFKKLTHATIQVVVEKRAAVGGLFGESDFKELAQMLLKGGRATTAADAQQTTHQAQRLLKASEGRMIGTDTASFTDVFAHSSLPQIAATVAAIEQTSKKHAGDFAGLLDSQRMSKSFRSALRYLAAQARGDPETHYARRLYKSMKGLGTDAIALNFNIVRTRESGLMEKTKAAFYRMYGTTLSSWIQGDAGGVWRKLLLALVGPENIDSYGALASGAPSAPSKVSFDVVARGDDVKRSLLKSDDVFVLDTGFQVFAWCGEKASSWERRHALQYAQMYVSYAQLPQTTPIVRIVEGGANTVFEASFNN